MWNHIHIVVNRDQGCDFNSQIHKQEVIWACICFPLVCPIQHAIDISLLQWDPGPTHLPVREANDAPPKQNFLEQATKINKDISQDQTSLFSAYNKSAQTTIITFCDFFKFQKLQFGLGKAARTSKTRGLQRLDQGTKDKGTVGWFNIRQNIKRNVISYDTSTAGQAGGGSFKKETNDKPKKQFAYRMPRKMTLQHHQMLHLPRTRQSCL